jgi:hypothetical protein
LNLGERDGSGSLAFPAPSSTLAVAGPVLEGFPTRSCSRQEGSACASPPCCRARPSWPSPLLQSALVFAGTPRGLRRGRSSSSRGIRPLVPLCRPSLPASTPGSSRSLRADGAIHRHPVPPPWCLTTSAGSSAKKAAGLLHPAAGSGVRRVSRRRLQLHPKVVGGTLPFPASRSDPSKSSPRQQPCPHRCGRCLLAVSVRPARALPPGSLPPKRNRRWGTGAPWSLPKQVRASGPGREASRSWLRGAGGRCAVSAEADSVHGGASPPRPKPRRLCVPIALRHRPKPVSIGDREDDGRLPTEVVGRSPGTGAGCLPKQAAWSRAAVARTA